MPLATLAVPLLVHVRLLPWDDKLSSVQRSEQRFARQEEPIAEQALAGNQPRQNTGTFRAPGAKTETGTDGVDEYRLPANNGTAEIPGGASPSSRRRFPLARKPDLRREEPLLHPLQHLEQSL